MSNENTITEVSSSVSGAPTESSVGTLTFNFDEGAVIWSTLMKHMETIKMLGDGSQYDVLTARRATDLANVLRQLSEEMDRLAGIQRLL